MGTDTTLRSIAIIGGGSAGWMSAAALSNALGRSVQITLVESEAIGTVGVGEATIPPIRYFNRSLGIDEATFIRETKGSFKLGIQFKDWGAIGESYFHPFGHFGAEFDHVPFYHHWLDRHLAGQADDLDSYTVAWTAARSGKFEPPLTDPRNVRSRYDYAYHFDAGLYARYLRRYAEDRGVTRWEGRVVNAATGPQGVASVTLEDGRELIADLFVDCTGFTGLLIEGALETGYADWSHWLPCNRAVAVPCSREAAPKPYTRATARAAGWQWRIPLQHRTGNGHVYCDGFTDAEAATRTLMDTLDGEPTAEPRHLRFTTGHRRKFWNGNVVAIGLSAGFMEPLESTSLHMIQYGIMRLLAMMPDRTMSPLLAREYNALTLAEYERIRDFLVLHYHATRRADSEFWRHCAAMPIPDSLSYKIAQFRENALLVADERELFHNPSWIAVYIGQGIVPKRPATVAALDRGVPVSTRLDQIKSAVADAPSGMAGHGEYIDRLIA